MIIGLGNDIVDIRRIEKNINKYGIRFIQRIYTEIEQEKAEGRALRIESYAKRWAAKEACAKALGTGIAQGVNWTDMGVVNLENGQPTLELTGGARRCLESLMPEGYRPVIHLSISDEYPMAQAVVIISALPEPVT